MREETVESVLRQAQAELESLYEGAVEGIAVVDLETRRFLRVNRAMCELVGYSDDELLSLSVEDIHPAASVPDILDAYEAARLHRQSYAGNLPCRRKDGSVIRVDIATNHLDGHSRPRLVGFFRDVTEQNRTIELLRASEDRYRLIADNVNDLIWTSPVVLSDSEKAVVKVNAVAVIDAVLDRWRFSFVSPAAERVFGYGAEEATMLSLREITTPASFAHIRQRLIEDFVEMLADVASDRQQHILEAEFLASDGSPRWCEVVSTYLRDEQGLPTRIVGITRDISARRKAERALRESESTLRSLFENLPDIVATVDRNANIQFVNRGTSDMGRETIQGVCGLSLVVAEHRQMCLEASERAFATGEPETVQIQDIFGQWWSVRAAPLAKEGDDEHALVICTNVTQERLAFEAVNKEQRLLRQMLELHERDRQLMAYEIHDGFAQQLAGASFRLQGFREVHARDAAKAWMDFDAGVRLISQAIDETRRLISGLRPPILDESGIVEAIDYLVYEHEKLGSPRIEFTHDVAFDRLAPPLESALFRITQESLQNACRHSHSDRIRINLTQTDNRICLGVRDWGVGFSPDAVEEQRFGLQGIRERARLLDGSVVIESSPGEGTLISVQLPLIEGPGANGEEIDAAE